MKYIHAFSLIELMVVVAVVAILSAVAVPSYTNYTTKAKASKGIVYSQGVIDKLQSYYSSNGQWPASASNIGLTLNLGTTNVNEYAPNIGYVDYQPVLINPGTGCSRADVSVGVTGINSAIHPTADMAASGKVVFFMFYIFEINGVFQKFCNYTYYQDNVAAGAVDIDMFPNCANTANATQWAAFQAATIAASSDACF